MEASSKADFYDSEGPRSSGDLFGGKVSLSEAIEKLRTRLLDLSSRNRLINYRHPKRRSIQFVDTPDLDVLFARVLDSKPVPITYVPDPPPGSYDTKRPEAKAYAHSIGIDTSTEFPSSGSGQSVAMPRTPKLQTLFYPTDLEKLCRRVSTDARTVIEESGTNMLYLIFGFFEFYEREDSEKPLMAPLVAVPVTLEKAGVDQKTRTYQYTVSYSGEDIHENQTLREKLSREFSLQLPEMEEEDELTNYFKKIEQAIQTRKNWKVKYQLSLGFLSFGKLALWQDLDTKKWPQILEHPLLNELFTGGSNGDRDLISCDYEIDNHAQSELPLIYDADSSQHSAIIDVLAGKNIVINGPPGTGKSQTITNVIAAALKAGKKVLFVSDKLAALEVVRHRLNQAHLGQFCLELHSHKTQKKKLLTDLQERLNHRFPAPQQLADKLSSLRRHKAALNRYAQLIGSQIGNAIGLTVHEIFWKSERYRQALGDASTALNSLFLPDTGNWTYDDIELRRSHLEVLAELYSAIGTYSSDHAWWGFVPSSVAPGDDEAIRGIVVRAKSLAEAMVETISDYCAKMGITDEPSLIEMSAVAEAVKNLPCIPSKLPTELLPRMLTFRESDRSIRHVIEEIRRAQELHNSAACVLIDHNLTVNFEDFEDRVGLLLKEVTADALSLPLEQLDHHVLTAQQAHVKLERLLNDGSYIFCRIDSETLREIDDRIRGASPLRLLGQRISAIEKGSLLLKAEVQRLLNSFKRVNDIAHRYGIPFDGTPHAIEQFRLARIEGLISGVRVDEAVIHTVKCALDHLSPDLTIAELNTLHIELQRTADRVDRCLKELHKHSRIIGLTFDASVDSVAELALLAKLAAQAPEDLLDYRRPAIFTLQAKDVLRRAEEACRLEVQQREELTQHFYLDSLPQIAELKSALAVFRRGDGLLNRFKRDWRKAKALVQSFSKSKFKRQKAKDYEERLTNLLTWVAHRDSISQNLEYKETFGVLFKGVETDFPRISHLCKWYSDSQREMIQNPGLLESIDLASIDSRKILQLAHLATTIDSLHAEINVCRSELSDLLSRKMRRLDFGRNVENWQEYSDQIRRLAVEVAGFADHLGKYVGQELTLASASKVTNAAYEMQSISEDLGILKNGPNSVRDLIEPWIPGISDVPCVQWTDYLEQLSRLSEAAASIACNAAQYASGDSTLASLRALVETKSTLDATIEPIRPLGEQDIFADWSAYSAAAGARISAANGLLHALRPYSNSGATAISTLAALNARKDTISIIQRILDDESLMNLLGDEFKELDTDVEALAGALCWYESVARNPALYSSPMFPLLLSSELESNLAWAGEILNTVIELRQKLRETIAELSQFGSIDWDEWISAARSDKGDEYASRYLNRHVYASENIDSVLAWSKYHNQRVKCQELGLSEFVDLLEQNKVFPNQIGKAFQFVSYRSLGRSIYRTFPELEGFQSSGHEKTRAEYIKLDHEIISLTGQNFAFQIDKAKVVPRGTTGYRASELTEMELLRRELNKQRRHLPIRQLIKRAGRAVVALKPCFMMGPMSVAQYIEHGAVEFDMVVMDEASQLRPEEALGAIARGKQLVVVGDPKQLPPTNFFDRLLDGDEEDDEAPAMIQGSESILDICQQLFHPARTLRWHYRSQHESLIAFSNFHFYNSQLLVFPSPFSRNRRLGVRYRYVKRGVYKDRQNVPEAVAVVDAVLDHIMTRPKDSLGVVTLNLTQRDLIEDLLDKKLRGIDEAEKFMSFWDEEGWPFFVKNLENVQGDERDVIFVSTTFGRAAGTDKVRQNFGPISRPDGWRRLNVLFTRARRSLQLFTSMLPEDIVVEANTPLGTRALKDYLDFAKRGVLTDTNISEREADSDFEIAVKDFLESRGYEVVPQLGIAGFFIDLAVRNPDRPAEFMAAIECDGVKYHSSQSARDRDRIRQAILESLGWKDRIWRIWSTDWFYNPRRESARLLAFLQERAELSRKGSSEWDFEGDFDELDDTDEVVDFESKRDISDATEMSISDEDLFVEVGDTVTYCYATKPTERVTITIVEGESVPQRNLTNESSAIAKALLNCRVGDEAELVVESNSPVTVKILKIQRQGNFWGAGDSESKASEGAATPVTSEPIPSIGQKTNAYPFRYGYCQCGCGQFTKMANNGGTWIWNKYIEGHESEKGMH